MEAAVAQRVEDDQDVVVALRDGDRRRALTILMQRYGDAVYRFALEMTRDPSVAEEARQQTFVEAYRDIAGFEQRSSLKTWLFAIARHRCLDGAKLRDRWLRRYKNEAREPEVDAIADLDRALDRGRLARLLAHCLGRLAPAARETVLLRYQQELPYDELATITGERVGTLQQRVARALPVLRRCLEAKLATEAHPAVAAVRR